MHLPATDGRQPASSKAAAEGCDRARRGAFPRKAAALWVWWAGSGGGEREGHQKEGGKLPGLRLTQPGPGSAAASLRVWASRG